MVPVYHAISLEKTNLEGGTTKPWVVKVLENQNLYVVKLFSTRNIQQYSPLNKELFGSLLAIEFDLLTPEPVLIKFSDEFIDSLNPDDMERINDLPNNLFFGCKFLNPNFPYSPAAIKGILDDHDLETIFAFDVLIRNIDRRINKPNMFLHENQCYLFDHEQTLLVDRSFSDYYQTDDWRFIKEDIKGRHIFYDQVKKHLLKKGSDKNFDTFAYYLNNLSLRNLDENAQLLKRKGIDVSDYDKIDYYLRDAKIHSLKVIELLRRLLQ